MDTTGNKKNKVNFYDIVNNPDYYERIEDGHAKDFFVCADCGYIPKSKIDTEQTKFLDTHCKCGTPVILATFSLEELDFMENDRIESRRYGMLCEATLSEVFGKCDIINFKSKFPRDILNEVKWKGGYDLSKCTIYYINRGSPNDIGIVEGGQIIEIGKGFLILEGIPYERYIPYHRIVRIEYGDVVIFEKP